MRTLDFPLDVKDVGEDGVIEGIAAAYNNIDIGGDIVLPGAFTKSLAGRKSMPMLLYHDQRLPVGVWDQFTDTARGLKVKGRITVATQSGAEALALAKSGALAGLSIGYTAIRQRFGAKARELVEVGLHEVSLVTVPMNDKATILSVKEMIEDGRLPTVREFEEHLRDAGFSKSLAAGIATKAAPLLRGDPEVKADGAAEFWRGLLG